MNKNMMLFSCCILGFTNSIFSHDLILDSESILIENNDSNKKSNFKIGVLFENENIKSGSDKAGTFERTYYLELEKNNWQIYWGIYQENYNVSSYYTTKGRDSWFDRYETTVHYQFNLNERIDLGLLGGFRYYRWHYNEPEMQGKSYTTRRYDIQPDWTILLTNKLTFSGWLGLFNYTNNIEFNGLTDKEIEGETGVNYTINNMLDLSVNYYINKGWNNGQTPVGEFSQQEIRIYTPITLLLFAGNPTSITPYYRHSIDTYHFDDTSNKNHREKDRRYGMLVEQNITDNLYLALEYAFETQKHAYVNVGEKKRDSFHYTALNVSYSF